MAAGAAPQLEPVAKLVLQPHAGPRHIEFGPDGRFAYTVNELDNTVTSFAFEGGSGGQRNDDMLLARFKYLSIELLFFMVLILLVGVWLLMQIL